MLRYPRVRVASGPAGVAANPPRDDLLVAAVGRRPHAEGSEDPAPQERGIGGARGLLDDRTEEDVARVVVAPARPGRELHRLLLEAVDQLGERHVGLDLRRHPAGHPGVALDPGRVGQEVLDRDDVPLRRVVRQELRDRVGEGELSLLGEHEDRHGRELLRHRPEPEDRIRAQRDVELEVGHPDGLPVDHLAVPDGDDGGAGTAGQVGLLHQRVDRASAGAAVFGAGEAWAARANGRAPSASAASIRRSPDEGASHVGSSRRTSRPFAPSAHRGL